MNAKDLGVMLNKAIADVKQGRSVDIADVLDTATTAQVADVRKAITQAPEYAAFNAEVQRVANDLRGDGYSLAAALGTSTPSLEAYRAQAVSYVLQNPQMRAGVTAMLGYAKAALSGQKEHAA